MNPPPVVNQPRVLTISFPRSRGGSYISPHSLAHDMVQDHLDLGDMVQDHLSIGRFGQIIHVTDNNVETTQTFNSIISQLSCVDSMKGIL